jgi:hypothetical protein
MRWAFFPFLFAEHSARSTEKVFLFCFSLFFLPPFARGTKARRRGGTVSLQLPTVLPLFYRCFYYCLLLLRRGLGAMLFLFDFFFMVGGALCGARTGVCGAATRARRGRGLDAVV